MDSNVIALLIGVPVSFLAALAVLFWQGFILDEIKGGAGLLDADGGGEAKQTNNSSNRVSPMELEGGNATGSRLVNNFWKKPSTWMAVFTTFMGIYDVYSDIILAVELKEKSALTWELDNWNSSCDGSHYGLIFLCAAQGMMLFCVFFFNLAFAWAEILVLLYPIHSVAVNLGESAMIKLGISNFAAALAAPGLLVVYIVTVCALCLTAIALIMVTDIAGTAGGQNSIFLPK